MKQEPWERRLTNRVVAFILTWAVLLVGYGLLVWLPTWF